LTRKTIQIVALHLGQRGARTAPRNHRVQPCIALAAGRAARRRATGSEVVGVALVSGNLGQHLEPRRYFGQ
jgi:hypothetical protein